MLASSHMAGGSVAGFLRDMITPLSAGCCPLTPQCPSPDPQSALSGWQWIHHTHSLCWASCALAGSPLGRCLSGWLKQILRIQAMPLPNPAWKPRALSHGPPPLALPTEADPGSHLPLGFCRLESGSYLQAPQSSKDSQQDLRRILSQGLWNVIPWVMAVPLWVNSESKAPTRPPGWKPSFLSIHPGWQVALARITDHVSENISQLFDLTKYFKHNILLCYRSSQLTEINVTS